MKLSVEEVIDFIRCPSFHYFKNVSDISTDKKFGRFEVYRMAKKIAYYFFDYVKDNNKVPTQTELSQKWNDLFEEAKPNLMFSSPHSKKKKINAVYEFIKKFYIHYRYNPERPIDTNIPYSFKLGNHTIEGHIPIVRETKRGIEVLELDLSSYYPDEFKTQNNIEYSLNIYAYRKIFEQKEDLYLLHNVRKNKKLKIVRESMDFKKTIKQINDIATNIEEGRFWQRIHYLCKSCPYQEFCSENLKSR